MINISVVIPVFNHTNRLQRAVESVLNQTLTPKEIIIVDDGSIEESAQILKS